MNSYQEVTRTSFLQNIMGSFVGAGIGLLIFGLAFVLIWWNEGKTNLADVARESVAVSSAQVDAAQEGKLVAVTGNLTAAEPIGDDPYLEPGKFLVLERKAEMYAWVEESRSETKDKVGGGSETTTTYTYETQWTDSPDASSDFKQPAGHSNPTMEVKSSSTLASSAALDAYQVDLTNLSLPGSDALSLSDAKLKPSPRVKQQDNFLYLGNANPSKPKVGDVRISYSALPSPLAATVFGQQTGSKLVSFPYDNGSGAFYRAFQGDRNQSIAQLETENTMLTWGARIGSFFMLWFGLGAMLGPISALLGVLPILKQAAGFVTGIVTFVIALVIWGVATLIAVILHNIWLAIAAAVVVIVLAYYLIGRRQQSALVGAVG